MIGRTLSHYRIIGILGSGGLSATYVAEDTYTARRVAIKVHTSPDNYSRGVFRREARLLADVSHPRITNIYDYGETSEGTPYIVMELVEGLSLAELLRKRSLTLRRSVEIAKSVAEALKEIHSHGIVHRDIKPSNILIGRDDNVKIIDFGLGRKWPRRAGEIISLRPESAVIGTPAYIAPEQVIGRADSRSDLFSLGATLYESLTGRQPFIGASVGELIGQVVNVNPPPPSRIRPEIPGELDRIILKALAKNPENRYQSAGVLASDLDAIQSEMGKSHQIVRVLGMPGPPSLYFAFEGERVKGNMVEYGTDVDLVFHYANPPKDALIAFWGERLERILTEDVELGVTVIADGFTFRDGVWHQLARFKGGELVEPVRFLLRSVDHEVLHAGFFVMLRLYGCILYQFPIVARVVQSITGEEVSETGHWRLDLDLNEIITEKELA